MSMRGGDEATGLRYSVGTAINFGMWEVVIENPNLTFAFMLW